MAVDQAIIDRIRKMMQHAAEGQGAREAEVENALNMARRLMEKYNLTDADIRQPREQKAAYESIIEMDAFVRTGKLEQGDVYLARVPTTVCDCKFYTTERWEKIPSRDHYEWREYVVIYGLPRDVEVAAAMYKELLATVRALARFRYGKTWLKVFNSYREGFVFQLIARANQLKRDIPAETGTTAIVLVKDALVARYAKEKLDLGMRKASRSRVHCSSAYADGSADGKNISLGTNQIGGKAEPRKVIS